jgi:hypothetical protein
LKSQVVIDLETAGILGVAQGRGPISDLKLFKESGVQVAPEVWCLADSGYQGLQDIHPQTVLPVKKPRNGSLSPEDKHNNGRLAKLRIRVEQVIRSLKVFKLLADRYRNRRKRFGLRFSLIAGVYNFERALI